MVDDERIERASKHFFSNDSDIESLIDGRRKKSEHIIGLLKPYVSEINIQDALSIGSSYCLIEEELKKQLFVGASFICTDLDEDALNKYNQPMLDKRVMSAMELNFPDDSFDFIIAHQVLEHINEYPVILEEFRRICRPDGIIYINVPNPMSPMIGKLPSGEWPRPIIGGILKHIKKKFNRDFMTNTEKYHTGFTESYLRRVMPEFSVYDLRKDRLRQEFKSPIIKMLINLFPRFLLFIPIETSLWFLVKENTEK